MYTLIRLRDGTIMEAVVLANKQSGCVWPWPAARTRWNCNFVDWIGSTSATSLFSSGFCWRTMTKPAKRQSWRGQPVGTPANREARL